MRLLIACEYSGIVRDAFTAKGHDAMSCDILPTESPGKHYQGDVRDILYEKWDMVIAHPPCTYTSNAGARFLYPKGVLNEERLKKGILGRDLFMLIYNTQCKKICIENPLPSSVFCYPKHSQIIQPFEYGHPVRKKTYLWIRGLPLLFVTNITEVKQSTKVAGNWFNKGGKERQKNRARTFQGIADAMATQWG